MTSRHLFLQWTEGISILNKKQTGNLGKSAVLGTRAFYLFVSLWLLSRNLFEAVVLMTSHKFLYWAELTNT